MVRLLRSNKLHIALGSASFQSHNGAIAAMKDKDTALPPRSFQSHNGAIAAKEIQVTITRDSCFNPTMVRLLRASFMVQVWRKVWFQSHNGAIAAPVSASPLKVRIRVSIPQWCDCC